MRQTFDINPALAFSCGDEFTDYAVVTALRCALMVSYGFEDYERLAGKFGIPDPLISRTSGELASRLVHALDLAPPTSPRSQRKNAA